MKILKKNESYKNGQVRMPFPWIHQLLPFVIFALTRCMCIHIIFAEPSENKLQT